jgi:tetratricopeptide (TPR) repeat protein
MAKELFRYTPALEDPQNLKDLSVSRDKELKRILRALKEGADKKGNQHFLLVGPRGIGKTHLLLLIYHGTTGNITWNELCQHLNDSWEPILFAEEEYRMISFPDLLLEIVGRLRQEAPDEKLSQLTQRIDSVPLPGDAEQEAVLEYLSNRRRESGKKFLLLLDNLQDILPHFTEEDQGRLRSILMSEDIFMLVGTAPTLFGAVRNYEAPFYNFFETIWLQEIEVAQVKELIEKRLKLDGRDELLGKLDDYEGRLRAIVHLTGGNPRLILSLYQIFTESEILEVERDFIKLLDEMTPYFQDRMKSLSPQQRKVLDAVSLMDGPSSPTEIARFARLPVNVTNTQLKRLREAGFVRTLKEKKRKTLYDVSERLFRMWRQMRVEAGRKRVHFITKFIEVWFSHKESAEQLRELLGELDTSLVEGSAEETRGIIDRLYYIQEAAPSSLHAAAHLSRVYGLVKLGDLATAEREANVLLAEAREKGDKESLGLALWGVAFVQQRQEKTDKEIGTLKELSELEPENPDVWQNLASAYRKIEEYDKAIHCYRKAVEIEPDTSDTWFNMGDAYREKKDYDEAIRCYSKTLEIKPEMREAWGNMGNTYREKNEHEEAIRCYRKVLAIKPDDHFAWYNLGVLYFMQDNYDETIESYTNALKFAKETTDIVSNFLGRSQAFGIRGSNSSALKDAEKAYRLAKKATAEPPRTTAALFITIASLGLSLKNAAGGRYEKAIEHLRRVLQYSPVAPSDVMQEIIGIYFKSLLETKNQELLDKFLQVIEQSDQTDLIEFLKPYRAALQYLKTKDRSILNRLVPEIREIVEEMAEKVKEDE